MVEVVMTSIVEASLFQGIKKWKVAAAICAVMWAVGLLLISPVGKYWVDLLDDFTGAFALFVVALVEVLAVVHIYKLGRFSEDVAEMTGMRISKAMRLVYRYVTPIGIAILLLSSVMVFAVERRSNFQHSRQPSVGKGCVGTCGADANPPRGVCETRNMFCRCKRGWGGADCTTKIDTRVYSCPEDCNGQGVCDETTQQCTCFAEFEGESCRGDKYAKGFPPWALFVGFMVAIVSVLPIPLVAFWKHLRKRVKQKIDENPEATQTAMYPSSSRPPATPSNSTEDNASSDSDDDDDGPPPSALTSLLSCMPGKRKTGRQSARGVEMSQQNGRGGGREDRKHLPSSQPQFDDDDSDDERF
ncbi:unnamed protein product [Vitrella brassicaformis CCMP3155]|uniref:EGF-like domain-containing protein n=1 Tax=Vitrella brassicaformis (strain CCMP3155) TaxID=1169540 RepID=A0A0G4GKW5_VITBC|nr:unnamed protein product [Vitrella brassicaformis CCMP3155]|eukprot:CEM30637.1 unnamed protein product [Vitrella brassicaformis CCMP3155]